MQKFRRNLYSAVDDYRLMKKESKRKKKKQKQKAKGKRKKKQKKVFNISPII